MKILIVRAYPSLVDLKNNTYNQQEIGLASGFRSLGHEAGIMYYGGSNSRDDVFETQAGTIRIYYRKARVLLSRIAFYEDLSDLKERYDLIISNDYDQVETVRTVRGYAHKTIIYHGPYYDPVNKRYNLANRIFDLLFLGQIRKKQPPVVTKSALAKAFLEQKGLRVISDVGVGLDGTQLAGAGETENPLEYDFDRERIHLLYIGRIEPRRNTLFLLELLERLVREDPRYVLVMVGKGDEAYLEKVKCRIQERNLESNVVWTERLPQKQLPYLYRNCDFFLLPTNYEIWGMVLMEAMRFNLPVLTTYNGGSSSLITDGVNGRILELELSGWEDAVKNSRFAPEKLAEYNETILSEKCDWTNIARRILECYGGAAV